jgi:S1-C subfamily serine protease
MRENENDHEGQNPEYVSPWAPRPSAPRGPDADADDDLPPYYASEYPAAPDSPTIPARPVTPPTPASTQPPQPQGFPDSPTVPSWQPHQSPHNPQNPQGPRPYQPGRGYHPSGDRAENDTIAFGSPSSHQPHGHGDHWQPEDSYTQQAPRVPYPPDNLYGPGNRYATDDDFYGPYGSLPPPPPRPRGSRTLIYLAVAVIAASIGAAATVAINHGGNTTPAASGAGQSGIPAQHNNAPGSGANASLNLRSVERKVKPGLVDIISTLSYNNETAEGTGMIVSSSGLVLTNNHVINQSTSITATLADGGQTYQAKVLGYDASADVALLKLEGASGLPTVSFGNSSQLSIGTPVLALGNAEGRGGATPAEGIINALNRSINASDEGSGGTENLHGMLQTSAQIEQGDSGGALADNAGQVIGMITAANTSSSQPGGTIGFAIPINSARSIALQIASGSASSTVYIGTPGFLGIILPQSPSTDPGQQARDEQSYLAQNGQGAAAGATGSCIQNDAQLAAPSNIAPARTGVLIVGVFCGTAVNSAGLVPGDVITSVNGARVTAPDGLRAATAKYHPGQAIRLGWTDTSGGKHFASVTLGSGPVR